MPDHLHAILFVKEKMEEPLGMALRGFKQKCNQHYRELILGVSSAALSTQQTRQAQQTGRPTQKKDRRGEDRTHGLLFARGFNDKLLLREGQLQRWLDYLHDNPRRLLMKREQPLSKTCLLSFCRRMVLQTSLSLVASAWKPVLAANCCYLLHGNITTSD